MGPSLYLAVHVYGGEFLCTTCTSTATQVRFPWVGHLPSVRLLRPLVNKTLQLFESTSQPVFKIFGVMGHKKLIEMLFRPKQLYKVARFEINFQSTFVDELVL